MNNWIKTAASLAIIASFGMAHAQKEEKTQIQKPGTGTQLAPSAMTKASGPKVDETVKQTQKPSSGTQSTTGSASTGPKVDETVRQTQKPGEVPNPKDPNLNTADGKMDIKHSAERKVSKDAKKKMKSEKTMN